MTTEPVPPPPVHHGRSLAVKFAIAFVLGALAVAVAGGAGLYAYGQQYNGRILPGVRAGDMDLSGLTADQATAVLAGSDASLNTGTITLTGPDGEMVIDFSEIGRHLDTDAMVAAALAAGREGEPVADLIGAPRTALHGVIVESAVTHDPARLKSSIAEAASAIDRDPVDATLTVAEDGSYRTSASVDGRTVDQERLGAQIAAAVSRLDAPAELRFAIPYTSQAPATDTAAVENAAATAERMATDLVLTRAKDTWTVAGKKLRALISFATTADGGIAPIVDEGGIDPLIKPIAKSVNQAATNAGFKLSGSKIVSGSPSKEGLRFDLAATHAAVLNALTARQSGDQVGSIEPVVEVIQPAVTTAQAKQIAPKMRALPKARWTTPFHIYVNNGFGANIWIPAKLINGYVVGPGETFDFWQATGPVTRAKGYRQGGAIINGRTEPQGALAGGICSCSTTLFNAALRGGYKMVARRNHYYYIDRYPLGLDATVFISASGSKQTMSWVNDTRYPVLIRGINTRKNGLGYVTFQLYSVPTGRTVNIGSPVVKNQRRATDIVRYTSGLRAGQSQRVEYPVDGKDVWRTVTVYQSGKVLRRTTYYSHYSTITGVVLRGQPAAGPTSTPSPAP